MTAEPLSRYTDEQRHAVLEGRVFSLVVDHKRMSAHRFKIIRVSKPRRAKGDGLSTSVSFTRHEFADMLLSAIDGTEYTVRAAVKCAAALLFDTEAHGFFSDMVAALALNLLLTGWSLSLDADAREEREGLALSAFENSEAQSA